MLEHSRALTAITNPTTNSYRRLVPSYEAPVFIAWSRGNRSANIRISVYEKGVSNAARKRVGFRTPDPSCNPYLCFAAIMSAGLDGILKKIDPGDPVDENIYGLTAERRRQLGIKELPGSLKEAVECLKSDRVFLKPVFSEELVEKIVENGLNEYAQVSARPHRTSFTFTSTSRGTLFNGRVKSNTRLNLTFSRSFSENSTRFHGTMKNRFPEAKGKRMPVS